MQVEKEKMKAKKTYELVIKKIRTIADDKKNRYMAIGAAVIIVIIAALSIQTLQPSMALDCEYMSLGWLDDFQFKYSIMPKDAVQCDNDRGSVVIVDLGADVSGFAGDLKSIMEDELRDIALSDQLDYFDQICSSSNSLCCNGLIVYDGKINTVGEIDNKLAIITVNSQKPSEVSSFLEGVWSNEGKFGAMFA